MVLMATTAGRLWSATNQFWNRKAPSDWSDLEIKELITESPWAKAVHINPRRGVPGAAPAPDPAAQARSLEGRGGGAPAPMVDIDRNAGGAGVVYTVRWESAAPVVDALKTPFPADFANHYVIGMVDFSQRDAVATLLVKGKEPVQAGATHTTRTGVALFGFSKELLTIAPQDKEVQFSVDTSQFSLKIKFELKEMTYRGKLAL